MPYPYTFPTVSPGEQITASKTNAMHQAHVDNNRPGSIDDYSENVTQMRSTVDPGDDGSENPATTLAGEIERLRYEILQIKKTVFGANYWYSNAKEYVAAKRGDGGVNNPNNAGYAFQGNADTGIFNPAGNNELRLFSAGTNHLTLSGGLVTLPLGRLEFPATQNPSTSPNVLDDYEEGEWTPNLRLLKSDGTTHVVSQYGTRQGWYIKIGKLVYLYAFLNNASTGYAPDASQYYLCLTGHPFDPITNITNAVFSGRLYPVGFAAGRYYRHVSGADSEVINRHHPHFYNQNTIIFASIDSRGDYNITTDSITGTSSYFHAINYRLYMIYLSDQ